MQSLNKLNINVTRLQDNPSGGGSVSGGDGGNISGDDGPQTIFDARQQPSPADYNTDAANSPWPTSDSSSKSDVADEHREVKVDFSGKIEPNPTSTEQQ